MKIIKKTQTSESEQHQSNDFFFVQTDGYLKKINIYQVLFINYVNGKCTLYTKNEIYDLQFSLQELFKRLKPFNFEKCHRNYLVQIAHIDSVHVSDDLLKIASHDIPIGRTFKKQLISKLDLIQ